MTLHNRRLLWELQTINEIAEGISQSLELDDVLTGALQRIVRAFDAVGARSGCATTRTGRYEMTASVGPAAGAAILERPGVVAERAGDRHAHGRRSSRTCDRRAGREPG